MQKVSATTKNKLSRRIGSVAAMAALFAPAALHAETDGTTSRPVDFAAALRAPEATIAADSSSSSSSSDTLPSVALLASPSTASPMDGGMQPPPYRRRRYGRPTYSDRWHNADGSNRLAFVVGGGFNEPVGDASSNYLNLGWRVEGGAGINFSRKLAVMFQFDYDNFGIPGNVLNQQAALYNSFGATDGNGNLIDFSGLDGSAHIWSFTLNPTFNFYQSESVGAYAVVGGGFYHKVTNFTLPQQAVGYDPYYGYYGYLYQQTVDFYTSNAPGVTGGIGLTYKFSRFANQRLFAEARYVHTFNQTRYGDPSVTGNTNGTNYNFYPPNSNETSWIPITFGIRF